MEHPSYTNGGIPKIIHQTWKTTEIPEKWKKSQEEWIRLHPDWIYKVWTDDDIRAHISSHHPDLLALHDAYPYPIQRADLIRYLILHDYGGVYSDLDLYPIQNIESYLTLSSDYFVYSANTNCFTNAFMISRKQSPVWLEVISELQKPKPFWAIGKHLHVMTTTGPLLLHRVLKHSKNVFTVLPQPFFNPYSVADDLSVYKEGTVIRTLEGSSWHGWDSSLYNLVFRHRTLFIVLGVTLCIFILVMIVYLILRITSIKKYNKKILELCGDKCNAI
jgi:mannosyltransferase OCH1-like enzyme